MTLRKRPFENIVGKGENAGYAFSHFPTMFSILPKKNVNFLFTSILLSANVFNLDQSKFLSFGKQLTR